MQSQLCQSRLEAAVLCRILRFQAFVTGSGNDDIVTARQASCQMLAHGRQGDVSFSGKVLLQVDVVSCDQQLGVRPFASQGPEQLLGHASIAHVPPGPEPPLG